MSTELHPGRVDDPPRRCSTGMGNLVARASSQRHTIGVGGIG